MSYIGRRDMVAAVSIKIERILTGEDGSMNGGWHYLIAVGMLFVSFNIKVDGLQLLFPNCFGYLMIAIGCGALGREVRALRWCVPPAATLTVLAFPELFRAAVAYTDELRNWDSWTFYPYLILHVALCLLLALAVARHPSHRVQASLRRTALFAAGAVIVVEAFRFWMPVSGSWAFFVASTGYMLLLFMIYMRMGR